MYLLLAHLQIASLAERRIAALASMVSHVVGNESKALTVNQSLLLLRMLRRARQQDFPEPEVPQSVNELAGKLGWSRTNTQACLADLLKSGLVLRAPSGSKDKVDGRIPIYVLSAAGVAVAGRAKFFVRRCDAEFRKHLRLKKLEIAPTSFEGAASALAATWDRR